MRTVFEGMRICPGGIAKITHILLQLLLLVLFRLRTEGRVNLKFSGPCIVSIFQYISNTMQRYTVYLYLETALHVSGGTSTHHQEHT